MKYIKANLAAVAREGLTNSLSSSQVLSSYENRSMKLLTHNYETLP
jgi:hypothetical protein